MRSEIFVMLLSVGACYDIGRDIQELYRNWYSLTKAEKDLLSVYVETHTTLVYIEMYETLLKAFEQWDRIQDEHGAPGWNCRSAVEYFMTKKKMLDIKNFIEEIKSIKDDFSEELRRMNSECNGEETLKECDRQLDGHIMETFVQENEKSSQQDHFDEGGEECEPSSSTDCSMRNCVTAEWQVEIPCETKMDTSLECQTAFEAHIVPRDQDGCPESKSTADEVLHPLRARSPVLPSAKYNIGNDTEYTETTELCLKPKSVVTDVQNDYALVDATDGTTSPLSSEADDGKREQNYKTHQMTEDPTSSPSSYDPKECDRDSLASNKSSGSTSGDAIKKTTVTNSSCRSSSSEDQDNVTDVEKEYFECMRKYRDMPLLMHSSRGITPFNSNTDILAAESPSDSEAGASGYEDFEYARKSPDVFDHLANYSQEIKVLPQESLLDVTLSNRRRSDLTQQSDETQNSPVSSS